MLTEHIETSNTSLPQLSKKNRRHVVAIIALCSIALIAGLFAVFPTQFIRQVEISLIRQPTPYTQLFFSNPESLPARLHINRSNRFTFTIVNNEGRSELYKYHVIVSTAKSTKVVQRGNLAIANSSSDTRTVTIVPKFRKSQYLISVILDMDEQSIHFYGETS